MIKMDVWGVSDVQLSIVASEAKLLPVTLGTWDDPARPWRSLTAYNSVKAALTAYILSSLLKKSLGPSQFIENYYLITDNYKQKYLLKTCQFIENYYLFIDNY